MLFYAPIKAPRAFALAAVLLLSSLGACASAGSSSTLMPLGAQTPTPLAYAQFCRTTPQACGPERAERRNDPVASAWREAFARFYPASAGLPPAGRPEPARSAPLHWSRLAAGEAASEPSAARLVPTADLWRTVSQINTRINADVTDRSDRERFALDDAWALPALFQGRLSGDCEDVALAKRQALLEAGLPDEALSLALVLTRWREPHAVLVLTTTQGDYVLDSLNDRVSPWRRTGHTWLQRQAGGAGSEWRAISSRAARADSAGSGTAPTA